MRVLAEGKAPESRMQCRPHHCTLSFTLFSQPWWHTLPHMGSLWNSYHRLGHCLMDSHHSTHHLKHTLSRGPAPSHAAMTLPSTPTRWPEPLGEAGPLLHRLLRDPRLWGS